MSYKIRFLWLCLLWLAAACQAVPTSGDISMSEEVPQNLSANITPSPFPTQTATALPTVTPTVEFSATPTPSATPTILVAPSALQFEIFEKIWKTVADEYLYPDFNGVNWEGVHIEYRDRVKAGLTEDGFTQMINEMIALLDDDHSFYLSPQAVREEAAKYAGKNDFVGIGVLMSAIPERSRAVILTTFPGSPAEAAGLSSRDSILEVDGKPILDEDGFLRDVVRGPEGSSLRLLVQSPGESPREVMLQREQISGPAPVPYKIFQTLGGKRIGYILLITLSDSSVDEQVSNALSVMAKDGPLEGVILDNRQNSGGADTELRGVLGLFTSGTLGSFISRSSERPLMVESQDIASSQQIPLVVLVGPGSISYGEVLSGVLKDTGRAYLIGENTLGNVETLWGYDFEDGSRLWLAHESFRPGIHPDQDWEKTGIIPDLIVPANWDQVTIEEDPAILESSSYFDRLP